MGEKRGVPENGRGTMVTQKRVMDETAPRGVDTGITGLCPCTRTVRRGEEPTDLTVNPSRQTRSWSGSSVTCSRSEPDAPYKGIMPGKQARNYRRTATILAFLHLHADDVHVRPLLHHPFLQLLQE